MLRRKIYDDLMAWKDHKDHDCLLVKGQRQVGKTFIIRAFASRNYDHFIETNLHDDGDMRSVFEGNLDADSVYNGMMVYRDQDEFVPGSTLIFLDEIQDCPRARSALKNLSIDGRFDVIASGSLLGVSDRRTGKKKGDKEEEDEARNPSEGASAEDIPPLLPLGYEEHLTMYSLDFEEFLWARKFPQWAMDEVRACIRERRPIGKDILRSLNSHYRDYLIVGGMPEAVDVFANTGSYAEAGRMLDKILATCNNDINRYNSPSDAAKTTDCFNSIPWQLAETNKKFMYSRVGEGRGSAEKYGECLGWIEGAGYGNFCYRVRSPEHPLEGKVDRSAFKVYMSDTGMLMHMMGRGAMQAIYSGDHSYNMGAVAENAVAEALMKGGYPVRYYSKNEGTNRMELDFVVEMGPEMNVIEVKSGKDRAAPSLDKVCKVWKVDRRIMFANMNIDVVNGVECYPMFAASFMDAMEPEWDGPEFRRPPAQT